MKGFKNTTKSQLGHSFPKSNSIAVKAHLRARPMGAEGKFASGGLVGYHENPSKFAENMDWSDYKKGGSVKGKAPPFASKKDGGTKAGGRPNPFAKGGDKRVGNCDD